MKSLSISLFVVGACALVFVAEGLPRDSHRFKRQTTTETEGTKLPEGTTTSDGTQPTPTSSSATPASSSSTTEPSQNNNDFGIGAVAGIGGLTRGVGLGNFRIPTAADTKNDPLAPWGAFAGLNLGNGGRIGAGCQGLSCGVQLGHFVLGTPQILGLSRNILNPRQQEEKTGEKLPAGINDDIGIGGGELGDGGSGGGQPDFLSTIQANTKETVAKWHAQQQQFHVQGEEGLANFARFGGQFFGNRGDGNGGILLGGGKRTSAKTSEDTDDTKKTTTEEKTE